MTPYHFDEGQLEDLKNRLRAASSIVITTHHKPDGDAIGASLGLAHVLSACGIATTVVSPSEFPAFLKWMKGSSQVIDFIREPAKAGALLKQADLILCLDFNDPRRVEKMQAALEASAAPKVLIDHHLEPRISFFSLVFSYPAIASTCELLVHLLQGMGMAGHIDRDAAECLYTGIMTDTGSFRFNSVTPYTHQVVAGLLQAGARNDYVHEMIYDTFSEARLRFLGHMICTCMQVWPDLKTAVFSATKEDMDRFHHAPGDLEGIVNYGLSLTGVQIAALFSERDGVVKISFRSKGEFSVKQIAEAHFEGGGHRNAAGGKSTLSIEESIEKFKKVLPEYLHES